MASPLAAVYRHPPCFLQRLEVPRPTRSSNERADVGLLSLHLVRPAIRLKLGGHRADAANRSCLTLSV